MKENINFTCSDINKTNLYGIFSDIKQSKIENDFLIILYHYNKDNKRVMRFLQYQEEKEYQDDYLFLCNKIKNKEPICEDIFAMIKDYLENDLKNDLDPLYKKALEELVVFLRQPNATLFRGFIDDK